MPRLYPVLTVQESIQLGQALNLAHAERIHNAHNTLIEVPINKIDRAMLLRAKQLFWEIKATHKELGAAVLEQEQDKVI